MRHIFASRIAEIKDSPQWNRLSFISCACNGLMLMDESLQLLPAAETIDLSRNKFAKVDNLRKCTKLKHLDLGFNNLRSIASLSEVSESILKLHDPFSFSFSNFLLVFINLWGLFLLSFIGGSKPSNLDHY